MKLCKVAHRIYEGFQHPTLDYLPVNTFTDTDIERNASLSRPLIVSGRYFRPLKFKYVRL